MRKSTLQSYLFTAATAALLLMTGCASRNASMHELERDYLEQEKKMAMDLFVEGKVSESQEEYGKAIAAFYEALQYDPQSAEITIALTQAFIMSSKYRSALIFGRRAAEIAPDNEEALMLLYRLEQHEGNYERAISVLKRYMALSDETDISEVFQLARLLYAVDRIDEANKALLDNISGDRATAFEMDQTARLMVTYGQIDEGLGILHRIVDQDPANIDAWMYIGSIHRSEGDEDKAREVYQKALELNPDSPKIMLSIGNQCLSENDWDCAVNYFEAAKASGKAGELEDDIDRTLTALYFYSGREDDARELFTRLVEEGKDNAQLYFSLGKAMRYLDRYEEAEHYYRLGLDKDTSDVPYEYMRNAFTGYAQSLVALGKEDEALRVIREEAPERIKDETLIKLLEVSIYQELKRYDDAIAIMEWLSASHPDDISFMLQLSILYDMTDQFDKAENALLNVLKAEPDHALALNNLAYMYSERDVKLNKALDMVKKSLSIEPDNGAYHDTLGWIYYKKGDYKEARKHIERALEIADDDDKGVIYDHYGDILGKLGRESEAADAYRKAVEYGEDQDTIQKKIDALNL